MTASVDGLHLRKTFGPGLWFPPQPFGPDGWVMRRRDGLSSIIVTVADWDNDDRPGGLASTTDWIHASISHRTEMPSYDDLKRLHFAVWKGRGHAYQCFPPEDQHVNIHEHALHLYGRLDGRPALPEFGRYGSI